MKEAKVRNDKAETAESLDAVLDAVEARVESLVEVVKGLAAENERLKSEVAGARAKADAGGEAAMLLARYEDERNAVKERIERVLRTLDEGSGAGKA